MKENEKKEIDRDLSTALSSIEEIIEDARNGKMFILVDQEDRENEGDLVIPAQMATPNAINFMATYGRGLICLSLTSERIDALKLPAMAASNSSRHETAFTVSIEAKEGVTTGISTKDRAHTIAKAIDPLSGPTDIVTPGHVFPLKAREGGVLVRAGHTEAAVDICRLAGLNPSGVICEIMNDDGTMARLQDLVHFSKVHNLKIGTISDLIAYRRKNDNLIKLIKSSDVCSEYGGAWHLQIFKDDIDGGEHLVLTKGEIDFTGPVLVRMHVIKPTDDLLALTPSKVNQLSDAMHQIAETGSGVIVLLNDMRMDSEIEEASPQTLRRYGIGAQILLAIGIKEIILVTNSPRPKFVGLGGYGLRIIRTIPIKGKGYE